MLECLFGVTRPDTGTVTLEGRDIRITSPLEAIATASAWCRRSAARAAWVLSRPVGENLHFSGAEDDFAGRHHVDKPAVGAGLAAVGQLAVKTPSLAQLVGTLSGGNQQKVVIGKWLAAGTRILLLDEPTRGIDVNAKFELYELVRGPDRRGPVGDHVSSELPELLALSDRILVMSEGRIVAELDAAATDQGRDHAPRRVAPRPEPPPHERRPPADRAAVPPCRRASPGCAASAATTSLSSCWSLPGSPPW